MTDRFGLSRWSQVAETVMSAIGFQGDSVFEACKLGDKQYKLLNIDCFIASGWRQTISLRDDFGKAYAVF